MSVTQRRTQRQDTFDLRNEIHVDNDGQRSPKDNLMHSSEGDRSILEDDDSSNEDRDEGEYMDEEDDGSSSLSIPNDSIDFDLVYSLHNFAATVEGQASVVKGDSLFLMDDSNSYWWLVRVLTTQEVGYIPAENIETPFERLARLNKHRNVDLASATQEEVNQDRTRGAHGSPDGQGDRKVLFTQVSRVFTYPPAVWGTEEDEEEWEDNDMDYDPPYEAEVMTDAGEDDSENEMSWDSAMVDDERARMAVAAAAGGRSSTSPITPNGNTGSSPVQQQQQAPPPSQSPVQQQQPQQQQSNGLDPALKQQTSRERLYEPQQQQEAQIPVEPEVKPQIQTPVKNGVQPSTSSSSANSTTPTRILIDPATAEPVKLSLTPSIAKDAARQSILAQQNAIQEENAKRLREQAEAARDEENARKRTKKDMQPVSSASIARVTSNESVRSNSSAKLKKGRDSPAPSHSDEDGGTKKKKSGMFGLFRKKDKREKGEIVDIGRSSEDSSRGHTSPSDTSPILQQQQRDTRRSNAGSTPIPHDKSSPHQILSQHTLKMQQKDREQQALYEQYLRSSPATTPEASYGLQSASAVMPNNNNLSANFKTPGGRPGSLVLSPTIDGQGVPELSVIRVFAGPDLHTEATFKTVLLNTSTTSEDLIRQAMQRFRLPAGEIESNYYLEIKQVEGQSAVLLPHERPLGVFENLVEAAQMELPRVKRSSVGSISSVASNLSMHPAIKKLGMNDFTDDSAVKFYLNRKSSNEDLHAAQRDERAKMDSGEFSEDMITTPRISVDEYDDAIPRPGSPNRPAVTLTTTGGVNITAERFSSPSVRFAMQVFILPEDLPDGMVFDPQTEAILPKSSLKERERAAGSAAASASGVSLTERRKVLYFPKNTTVAEVIELGLERFGIAEGVVDGGDEVEDKMAKRVSATMVRYGLTIRLSGQERNLHPSSKVLDAFPRPPIFRPVDRRSEKRRSADSAMLLNAAEDIRPDDPLFVLRRAHGFRGPGKSKQPLDELALEKKRLQRNSMDAGDAKSAHQEQHQQMSRQELIAAQRQALRAKQRAILSAQSNSERGLDVILSGNRMLRSIQNAPGDRMRYSYIQDGQIIDISDLVEEEREREQRQGGKDGVQGGSGDWLETVARNINHDGLGDNLDRVLNRIKGKTGAQSQSANSGMGGGLGVPQTSRDDKRVSEISAYSVTSDEEGVQPPSVQPQPQPQTQAGKTTPPGPKRDANATPGSGSRSDSSSPNDFITTPSPSTPGTTTRGVNTTGTSTGCRTPLVVKGDFGVANMMAIIQYTANVNAKKSQSCDESMDLVDKMLFGPKVIVEELHPRVREMFAGTLKQLEDMDKQLDLALAAVTRGV